MSVLNLKLDVKHELEITDKEFAKCKVNVLPTPIHFTFLQLFLQQILYMTPEMLLGRLED